MNPELSLLKNRSEAMHGIENVCNTWSPIRAPQRHGLKQFFSMGQNIHLDRHQNDENNISGLNPSL